MSKYDMNLEEYLKHFDGKKRLEKIAEVTIQLLDIFKHIHSVIRTHNDVKPENVMINTNGNID